MKAHEKLTLPAPPDSVVKLTLLDAVKQCMFQSAMADTVEFATHAADAVFDSFKQAVKCDLKNMDTSCDHAWRWAGFASKQFLLITAAIIAYDSCLLELQAAC